jgi:hypothetical protein
MKSSYTTKFTVDQDAREVFNAITEPRRWWSQAIEGDADRCGAVFFYKYRDLHRCTIKVTELRPAEKVVWRVLHNDLTFVKDRLEWTDTDLVFEINRNGDKTELRFTHVGLVREFESYSACSEGWRAYINGSLRQLIATGEGRPNVGDAVLSIASQANKLWYCLAWCSDM